MKYSAEKYKLYKKGLVLEDQNTVESLDYLLENKFMFSRKYDMERCDWPIENDPIVWDLVPFGDPEWTFVLNRMDYCYDLCIQTIKTGDLKYIKKSKQLIFDWISKNKENDYNEWTRTLDSGIRLINWVECLKFFKDYELLTTDDLNLYLESISWQINYIDTEFQNFQNFSNWGMMQSIGILNAATVVDTDLESKYANMLKQHLTLEFLEDGMQWEQSAIYILEVLVRLLQLDNPKYKTKQYYDVLKRSSYPVRALTNIDGATVLIGDGDEVDTIGYLQRVAYILKDQELLEFTSGHEIREEVYWHFGDEGLAYFSKDKKRLTAKKIYTLDKAEFVSIKDQQSYLSFQNGNIGGGHGHFDNLHINYSVFGKKVLSDRGRYTYVEGSPERVELKGYDAHNVLSIDKPDLIYRNAWNNDGLHFYSGVKHVSRNGIEYLTGMASLADGKMTNRAILSFENGLLLIADYYNGDYQLNYHLDYSATIDKENLINDQLHLKTFNNEQIIHSDSFIGSVYNTKKESVKLTVKATEHTTISSFVPLAVQLEEVTDFTHMYFDRISEYEKNIKVFKMTADDQDYIIGMKVVDAGNVDNVIKVNDNYIHGSIFVYDCQTKENIVFKY